MGEFKPVAEAKELFILSFIDASKQLGTVMNTMNTNGIMRCLKSTSIHG